MRTSLNTVCLLPGIQQISLYILLLACGWSHAGVTGSILWYLEQEQGIQPYKVRYLVTEQFMRSDEGDDEGGFALFDRKTRRVYSVVPENRTVLSIDGQGRVPDIPRHLEVTIEQKTDSGAPRVAGQAPVTIELAARGKPCHTAVVAPGFPGAARAAFQEFASSLAVQQLRTLDSTPEEYRTPCFLSRFLYAADFHLRQGIPLVEWNNRGERRELIDYTIEVELDERLFELPDGYRLIHVSGEVGSP